MPTKDFDSWWSDFEPWLDTCEDVHEAARRIRRYMLGLKSVRQRRFFDEVLERLLQARHAYGVSLFLLEGVSDPEFLHAFGKHLLPLPPVQTDDEESHLADLIRILAAADDAALLPAIDAYLLERPIGPHWSSVPWALWPHRKKLFGRSWRRFFLEHEPADWKNTLVIKSFLTEPEAITVVRKMLMEECAEIWVALRATLIRQAGMAGWLSEEQRAELDRAIV